MVVVYVGWYLLPIWKAITAWICFIVENKMQITLTNKEAEAFVIFREHQDLFMTLIYSDVHKMKNGNAVLSFDNTGVLRKVRLEQVVYNN